MRVSAECLCRAARHPAAYVSGVPDARRAATDHIAVSLLELVELVELAKHENSDVRASAFSRGTGRRRCRGWSAEISVAPLGPRAPAPDPAELFSRHNPSTAFLTFSK